jgi:tryptophan synthase alpha chain
MTRIERTFERLHQHGKKALVGFLMAGDPDIGTSEQHCRTALENGVDILELGVPFSDPTADGPVIQAAGQRALAAGITLSKVLSMAQRLRKDYEAPIVLFGYVNPLFSHGYARVAAEAVEAGVDALLVVDLPFEESGELRQHLDKHGLDFITLVAPTTPEDRLRMILKGARGFVYYIMVKGVTGTRSVLATDVSRHLARLKTVTKLPLVAGFGVGSGAQARDAAQYAEGVVVGSALIKAAKEKRLAGFVRELRQALDSGCN